MTHYLSVCSGIEAASVAFEPLDWKPIAFSEIEAFPSAVLAYHYPTVPNLGDMTKWKSWDWNLLSDVDVLVGGTPCQAFSVAGLRAGLDDERGQLTISYIHILDHIDQIRSLYGKEPAICVWENVPGVLSSKDNAFGAFLGGLAGEDCELVPAGGKWTDAGCVYGPKRSVAWRVLDAQYFGVAQRRKRVFVIASARDIDPSEILFEFDGLRRDTPPSREAGQVSTSSVGGSSEKSYSIISDVTPKIGEDVCLTMRSQGGGGIVPPSVAVGYAMQGIGEYADLNIASTCKSRDYKDATDLIIYPIHDKATRHGGERGVSSVGYGSVGCPIPSPFDTGGNQAVAFHPTQDPISSQEVAHSMGCESSSGQASIAVATYASDVYPCIRSGNKYNNSDPIMESKMLITTQMQVRRLTPTECERLQGFRDGWTDVPHRNKPAADGSRYKALGNSMATPVMHWLGKRINDALIRLG